MYRTRDIGGCILAHFSILLIFFGQYIANRTHIFYWHQMTLLDAQFIQGIPLTMKGFIYCVIFNLFCCLAILTHLRAAFADPGRITEGTKAPF